MAGIKTIIVKGLGKIKFPAAMTDDEITSLLAKDDFFQGIEFKHKDQLQAMKPSAQQQKAYEIGKKHAVVADGDFGQSFYESLPADELRFVANIEESAPVSRAFYLSGLEGTKPPSPAIGYRHGDKPAGGVSYNHVEGRPEKGVSMAKVEGVDYEWAPMGGRAGSRRSRFAGWLMDPDKFWGADGEPLMVGLKKFAVPAVAAGLGAASSLVSPESQAGERSAQQRLAEIGQSRPTGTIQSAQHPLLGHAANALLSFETPFDTVTGKQFQGTADLLNKFNYGDRRTLLDYFNSSLELMP